MKRKMDMYRARGIREQGGRNGILTKRIWYASNHELKDSTKRIVCKIQSSLRQEVNYEDYT